MTLALLVPALVQVAIFVLEPLGDPFAMSQARTADAIGWTASDYEFLADGARRGGMAAEELLAVMGAESELQRDTTKGRSSGLPDGLTQMMGDTLWRFGWRKGHPAYDQTGGDFGKASVKVQLDFAFRYFAEWRARFQLARWENTTQLFLANFLPAEIPHAADGSYVLAGQGKRVPVYRQNPRLDRNHDGAIVVAEAAAFVRDAIAGRARARYEAALQGLAAARARMVVPVEEPSEPEGAPRLRTATDVRGVQLALLARGYGVGPRGADGLWGPSTRDAVRAFQSAEGLRVDGVVGPYTFLQLSAPLVAA